MNATATALQTQQDRILADYHARSISTVLDMLRHWLREAEMMLPTGKPVPAADRYQANLIAAWLRPMGADIVLNSTDSHVNFLDISVSSNRGGLDLLRDWAETAELTLIYINKTILHGHQPGRAA